MQLYQAQYIYPVSAPPRSPGIIAVDGDRIAAVGTAAEMTQRYPGAPVTDLGSVMLMPQAVNAHTHLELTPLAAMGRQPLADRSFLAWIMELGQNWRAVPASVQAEGARDGCRMLIESGTAAVGDISSTHHSLEPLVASGLYGIIYHEVLSPDPATAEPLLQQAQECIRHWRSTYGEQRIRFGVTLHTPLTVAPEAFRLFLPWIIEEQVPLCIHAAESPAELDYFMFGMGEVTTIPASSAFRQEWIPSPSCSPIRYLEHLGVLKAQPLLVHGVQVDRDDARLLAGYRVPMVHCPRSNYVLNCGRMPIEFYLEAGVPLAMGTDGLSSSPSLNVWEEAISAVKTHRAAGVNLDSYEMLRLCTLDGASVLGMASLLGSLEPGKLAKFAIGRTQEASRDPRQALPTADEMLHRLWEGEVPMRGSHFSDINEDMSP